MIPMLSNLAVTHGPFIPAWSELRFFAAELWLIIAIAAVLLTPFFTPRKSNIPAAMVALLGLLTALGSLLIVGLADDPGANRLYPMLVADAPAMLWKVLLLLFSSGIVLMWLGTTSSTMHEGDGPEFFVLLLGATLGMCLMSSTTNLLMLVMAIEMASLPSYVLAGFRKTRRLGAEASIKYVLFGAATSSIMIYGLSMLYGLYGSLQLERIAEQLALGAAAGAPGAAGAGATALTVVALVGLIIGIGFKISAVPLHFWCPDVFEGASMEVSAFLSVASKGAALVLLLRVLMVIASALGFENAPGISLTLIAATLGIMGAVSATVGNTAALFQENIKRLLAYSSIAHAGYMLCALSVLINHGDFHVIGPGGASLPGQALLLYLAVYVFMNLGAFTVAGLIYRQTGSENIPDYAGLGRRSPVLAACMGVFMFSLVGLPPLAGFVAKVNVLWVLIQAGGWWWVLVGVIGVNTIISLFYYVRVLKVMYLQPGPDNAPAWTPNPIGTVVAVVCAVAVLLMFFAWQPLNDLTTRYSRVYTPAPPPVMVRSDPVAR